MGTEVFFLLFLFPSTNWLTRRCSCVHLVGRYLGTPLGKRNDGLRELIKTERLFISHLTLLVSVRDNNCWKIVNLGKLVSLGVPSSFAWEGWEQKDPHFVKGGHRLYLLQRWWDFRRAQSAVGWFDSCASEVAPLPRFVCINQQNTHPYWRNWKSIQQKSSRFSCLQSVCQ